MSPTLIIRKAESLSFPEIHAWLAELRPHSLAHFSRFQVASILRIKHAGESYYVAGVNVENHEFGLGSCAEEGAVSAAVTAFGPFFTIEEIYVTGMHISECKAAHPCYPCGECRQRLAQYVLPSTCTYLIVGDEVEIHTFNELFPFAFSFKHIEQSCPQLVISQWDEAIELVRETRFLSDDDRQIWIRQLTGDMRISGISEAVLLELDNGYTIAGVNVENPAYTASSGAFAAAVSIGGVLFGDMRVERVFCHWKDCRKQGQPVVKGEISGAARDVLRRYASEDVLIFCL